MIFLKENASLLFILITGSFLRFYDFFEIPYMHDELSALLRTNYNSFSEVVNQGVKEIDTHPPLIQVFLYYWTSWFGYEGWIVKLPFILSGIASIYLAYKIGHRWASKTTGLLIAAIIAYSEYTLLYGQIIRPYTSGLFFMLLASYHWGELVFFESRKWKHQVWFVLGALLCAYNHHFSMFSAVLMGIGGIFLVDQKNRWSYLLLCAIALLLYLPILPITLHQLSFGGIGNWLAVPDSSFFRNYLYYVFNFSIPTIAITLLILLFFFFKGVKSKTSLPAVIFSGLLFTSVFVIAYIYSVYVSSVLQYSVLIFAFPFLLIFVFGWIKNQAEITNFLAVAAIGVLFIFTLVFQRSYYSIFYVPIFKQLVLDADQAQQSKAKTLSIIFVDEPKVRFYEQHLGLSISSEYVFVNGETFNEHFLDSILQTKTYDQVYYGGTLGANPICRSFLLSHFPQLIWQKNYCGASSILLRKGKPTEQPLVSLVKNQSEFNGFNPSKWSNKGYAIDEGVEWTAGYGNFLHQFTTHESDIIDVVVKIKLSDLSQKPLLVLSCQAHDSTYRYQNSAVEDFTINYLDSTVTLYQSLNLIDFEFTKDPQQFFNTFIWNTDKKALKILGFEVFVRKGNPIVYALYKPFKKLRNIPFSKLPQYDTSTYRNIQTMLGSKLWNFNDVIRRINHFLIDTINLVSKNQGEFPFR